jgi:hypothetical protein
MQFITLHNNGDLFMSNAQQFLAMATLNANTTTDKIDTASKQQSSQALIVQGYALSVLQQPNVDFSGFPKLKANQDEMNAGIASAKGNANLYLNTILPNMITTIANIDAYFQTQNALATALAPGTDVQTAIALIRAVQEQAQTFQAQSNGVVTSLQSLRTGISTDASNFNSYVTKLNAAVNGDNGVLSSINDQLGSIDGKIAGAAVGVALSGLAIAGGVFMVLVGSIAEFVTAGTSTPLVVAGVGVIAAGVGGEVGASIALANLLQLKGDLLSQKSQLTSEVNLATGISSGFKSLADGATAAVQATQEMANAWSLLGDDLGSLVNSLTKGQTTVDALRTLFVTAAQGNVKTVQQDVITIKGQLTGVQTKINPNAPVSQAITDQVAKLRLAA